MFQFLQIDRINEIYRSHTFGVCGKGFGFEIKEVCLFQYVFICFLEMFADLRDLFGSVYRHVCCVMEGKYLLGIQFA